MKIGMYTDVHYCTISSIIRTRGERYSSRIENCIKSINWAEDLFKQNECSIVVCLGDLFDRNNLIAEEIRGLNDLKFYEDVTHYFLVGNHEISRADCTTSSMHVFNSYPFIKVIDTPTPKNILGDQLLFLPYITEENRKPILNYCTSKDMIVMSHNDIKGIRYGSFVSEEGFDLDDIKANCKMFINGHLHNGQFLNDKETILNLGNLTGQNFSEDASKYRHYACILDTDTMKLTFYENPYAYNFYKIDLTNKDIKEFNYNIDKNAVVTFRVKESDLDYHNEQLKLNTNIVASRTIVVSNNGNVSIDDVEFNHIDHLELFKSFVLTELENTDILRDEINRILE